jgi:hypothetical protein
VVISPTLTASGRGCIQASRSALSRRQSMDAVMSSAEDLRPRSTDTEAATARGLQTFTLVPATRWGRASAKFRNVRFIGL